MPIQGRAFLASIWSARTKPASLHYYDGVCLNWSCNKHRASRMKAHRLRDLTSAPNATSRDVICYPLKTNLFSHLSPGRQIIHFPSSFSPRNGFRISMSIHLPVMTLRRMRLPVIPQGYSLKTPTALGNYLTNLSDL